MNSKQFTEKVLKKSDRIIIDSSSLMDTVRLNSFIEQYGPFLKKKGKKIFIPKVICCELTKHLCNKNKVELAMRAIEIVSKNDDIFEYDHECFTDQDIRRAFGDPKLLALLVENISQQEQLFITQDRSLAEDALKYNNLACCKNARKVYAAQIGNFGCLNQVEPIEKPDVVPIEAEVNPDPAPEPKTVEQQNAEEVDDGFRFPEWLRAAGLIALGVGGTKLIDNSGACFNLLCKACKAVKHAMS